MASSLQLASSPWQYRLTATDQQTPSDREQPVEVPHLDRKPRPLVLLTETKSGHPRSVPLPLRTAKMLEYRRRTIPLSQRLVFSERARKDIWTTHDVAVLYAQK